MSTPPTIQYSDRPLKSKKRDELDLIAVAMGLPITGNKPDVLKAIERHIKANPQLADDHLFLPLFAHRAAPKAGHQNSATKAAAAASEASKAPKPATGANKTLLDNGVKADPPPQFSKLPSGAKAGEGAPINDAEDSDLRSAVDAVGSVPGTPEPKEKPKTPEIIANVPGVVQVNFFDENNHAVLSRQVCVLSEDVPISVTTAENGNMQFTTSLSRLIPAAIHNDSPIKDRGGRLYRPNIRGEPAHHHLGRIDALLAGEARTLAVGAINEYTLAADDGDTLVCNLFWDQSSQAIGDAGGATAVPGVEQQGPQNVHSLEGISGINPPPVAHERLRFTGAGTDIPLAIATDRAMHNPTHRLAAPRVHASFVDFLRARMVEVPPSIPEGQWPRAKTAGIILQRIQIQEKVLAHFTPWSKPSGGYIVPAGSGEYSGVIFTKPEILEALRLKGSNSTSDLKIFTPDALLRNPQAKLWYESGERRKERSRVRRRRSSSVEEGPSRKHRKTHVSSGTEDESEDEQHLAKKSKSAGKRKATADSEDLDK
ncbi:hypothetical protein B0H10DRAFT_2044857 [Mycena sp. CBHHK59/15]|nr:hypothetical protein B0H10DRAFT_2044857 [Mycena sp. CBHHK59/15]